MFPGNPSPDPVHGILVFFPSKLSLISLAKILAIILRKVSQAVACDGQTYTVDFCSLYTGTQANPLPLYQHQNIYEVSFRNKLEISAGYMIPPILQNPPYLQF